MKIVANTEEEYADLICQEIFNQYQFSIEDHHFFTFVLSGGNTPKLIFNELVESYVDKIDWGKVHFFWTDERCVSKSHSDSNFKLAFDFLLRHINPASINRMECELRPEIAADNYEEVLIKFFKKNSVSHFDLILLGMGVDGHTASLFPNGKIKYSKHGMVGYVSLKKNGYKRLSLSMHVLNDSSEKILMVSSSEKEELLENKCNNFPVDRLKNIRLFVLR